MANVATFRQDIMNALIDAEELGTEDLDTDVRGSLINFDWDNYDGQDNFPYEVSTLLDDYDKGEISVEWFAFRLARALTRS